MAETNEAAYERIGDNSCISNQIEGGSSLGDRLEPASFLNYVVGGDEAGSETINDIATTHYTFDQHALGQQDLAESNGEMWVAVEGGYVVRYVLTTKGKADYFGEGIEDTLSFDYELTEINQPVRISLPADCPPSLVDVPRLADASNVINDLGMLTYTTASSVKDAAAFYQQELANLGWQVTGEPFVGDTTAFLSFDKDGETMIVNVTTEDDGTKTVQLAQIQTQE